jgi:hypothetical protein
MGIQTSAGSWTTEGVQDSLTTMIAGDPFAGAHLHLYQSSFNPNTASKAADFAAAEATFTGYAAAPLTYSAIGIDQAGNPTVLSGRAFFQATDAVTPNTIGGCWVQRDVVGPPAVATSVEWYPFNPPVPMSSALAFVGVVLGIQAPAGPGYAVVDN